MLQDPVDPRDAHVGDAFDPDPRGLGGDRGLVGDREVGGSRRHHGDDRVDRHVGGLHHDQTGGLVVAGARHGLDRRRRLFRRGTGDQHGAGGAGRERHRDPADLFRRLAGPVDRLGMSGPQLTVMVDPGVGHGFVRERAENLDGVGDRRRAGCHVVQQPSQRSFVHEGAHRILRRLHRKPQVDGRFAVPGGAL